MIGVRIAERRTFVDAKILDCAINAISLSGQLVLSRLPNYGLSQSAAVSHGHAYILPLKPVVLRVTAWHQSN